MRGNAILAAAAGTRVMAVDINPKAIEATRANAERNGVAERVEVRSRGAFSAAGESFDLIVPEELLPPDQLTQESLTASSCMAATHRSFRPTAPTGADLKTGIPTRLTSARGLQQRESGTHSA